MYDPAEQAKKREQQDGSPIDTIDQLKKWLSSKGIKVDNFLDILTEEQAQSPKGFG